MDYLNNIKDLSLKVNIDNIFSAQSNGKELLAVIFDYALSKYIYVTYNVKYCLTDKARNEVYIHASLVVRAYYTATWTQSKLIRLGFCLRSGIIDKAPKRAA